MARINFETLQVYQMSETLADNVWEIVTQWDSLAKDTVGKQMVGSADSTGTNLAEGSGRGSFQDNRRLIRIAGGSLYETRHWLRRACKRNLLTEEQVKKLNPVIENLSPMRNGYLRSIGKVPEKTTDYGLRTTD